jgi:hypothetical protein
MVIISTTLRSVIKSIDVVLGWFTKWVFGAYFIEDVRRGAHTYEGLWRAHFFCLMFSGVHVMFATHTMKDSIYLAKSPVATIVTLGGSIVLSVIAVLQLCLSLYFGVRILRCKNKTTGGYWYECRKRVYLSLFGTVVLYALLQLVLLI